MVIRIRPNPDALNFILLTFLLYFFLPFLLLVPELAIIHNPAHRRLGIWCHFNQVHAPLVSLFQCLGDRHNP